jgi:hygromycin-B 4-O-kinase
MASEMSKAKGVEVDVGQAHDFLTHHFAPDSSAVELIGEGAWSRCFGFRRGPEELVIRFGHHLDDFQKDQRAYTLVTPDLPIPQVLAIGQAFDGYYAISTRVYGVPLENLSAHQWRAVVPALTSALEALRTVDLSATVGFGGWGADGNASQVSWADHLLRVGDDTPNQRTHGWRGRLAASTQGEAIFTWGYDLLTQVASDAAPRALLHCDLINRNVLVNQQKITGIFDWGCSLYGDHLYELAWFEFWAPWLPELNIPYLRAELERRWQEVGYLPQDQETRLLACYLHIGLDHLAYNAYRGDWASLTATAKRMRTLV